MRLMGRQSRGLSMVEIEESAQAVAPLHVGGRAPRHWRLLQKAAANHRTDLKSTISGCPSQYRIRVKLLRLA